MEDTLDRLVNKWQSFGNDFVAFRQQGAGYCTSFCQHWITLLERGYDNQSAIEKLDKADVRGMVGAWYNKKLKVGLQHIPGFTRSGAGARTLMIGNMGGPDTFLAKIFSPRGRYILSCDKGGILGMLNLTNTGGHSVAFNTSNSRVSFFDPNTGVFWSNNNNEGQFKSWFKDYWTAAIFDGGCLKDQFHRGSRELHRYSVGGNFQSVAMID